MLVVKFQAGSLGHFLFLVLYQNISPMTVLDHGKSIGHKILHTGAYHTPEDKDFKKRIELKKYLGITHNNINFESWIKSLDETNN